MPNTHESAEDVLDTLETINATRHQLHEHFPDYHIDSYQILELNQKLRNLSDLYRKERQRRIAAECQLTMQMPVQMSMRDKLGRFVSPKSKSTSVSKTTSISKTKMNESATNR